MVAFLLGFLIVRGSLRLAVNDLGRPGRTWDDLERHGTSWDDMGPPETRDDPGPTRKDQEPTTYDEFEELQKGFWMQPQATRDTPCLPKDA